MKPNFRSLVIISAFLSLFAGMALADDTAGKPGSAPDREKWCADNPQKCQEMKSHMQEKCAQDPKRCEEMKACMAEMKAKCDANPEECRKKREQMKSRRAEMRAKCEANPKKPTTSPTATRRLTDVKPALPCNLGSNLRLNNIKIVYR